MGAFQIIRIVSYVVLAWIAVSTIGRLHWLFSLLVTALAIWNVVIIWMLREYRPALAVACRQPLLRKYVGWICYFTNEQLPLETEPEGDQQVLLRTQRDFEIAGMRAKQIVRGHDRVLDTVLWRIYENQTPNYCMALLRSRYLIVNA